LKPVSFSHPRRKPKIMNPRLTLTTVSAVLVLGAAVLFVSAKDADNASAADAHGYLSVFNGKDLTGWIYGGTKDRPVKSGKGYQVENGVMFCTADDGGMLFTEKEYGDFGYSFDFKLEPNSNNGIGIRSPLQGDPAYVGMEIQVLDDSGSEYTDLRPAQYHGSIYDVVPAKRGSLKPVGQWNHEEITAHGRHVMVKLNGNTIVDANLDDVKDEKVLKKHPGLARAKGHIGLLGHGTRVEFRDMKVKELNR
jgi:hypothetical protein